MDIESAANDDMVNIMTLHSAKGLEFDSVFLPGWEEGLFPHELALQEKGEQALEEERRLAYVGLTRARRKAVVSFAANRRIHGQWQSSLPSRFIDELPEDHIDFCSAAGLYGGSRQGSRGGLGEGVAVFGGQSGPQKRRQPGETIVEARFEAKFIDGAEGAFQIGDRVFHQKFGYGRIVSVDGGKLEIAFDKAGGKKVMASFVEAV